MERDQFKISNESSNMDFILTLYATSSEVERGFCHMKLQMKLINTNIRSKTIKQCHDN